MQNLNAHDDALVRFAQRAVQTQSYSDHEEGMVRLIESEMRALCFDEILVDRAGNIAGRVGSGPKVIQFDGHMDTVEVQDAELWDVPPFEGRIVEGVLWGRGSVDMKSSLCAAIYAAAAAKREGLLEGKTVWVTGTVCEEYCDGVNLEHFYDETGIRPDCCVICEPSNGLITLGHKGKAQVRIKTRGVSAHGSAPEKGKNAVYEMAEIITRVDELNRRLFENPAPHGTVVLSQISSVSASLNAVPSECEIYLDRRLAPGETLEGVKREMEALVVGKDAFWEPGTLRHTSWKGEPLVYEPMHDPWSIPADAPLTRTLCAAWEDVMGRAPERFDFWDFGTNAVTPIRRGIPTIGLGAGEYKLAHMRNERCAIRQILEVSRIYTAFIQRF